MGYIPIIIPVTPDPPSPRTRELAGLLGQILEEYQKAHPSVTGAEMREAIQLAKSATGGNNASVAIALSLGIGLLVMAVVLGLVFLRTGGDTDIRSSMPMVILGVTVFLGIILAAVKVANK